MPLLVSCSPRRTDVYATALDVGFTGEVNTHITYWHSSPSNPTYRFYSVFSVYSVAIFAQLLRSFAPNSISSRLTMRPRNCEAS